MEENTNIAAESKNTAHSANRYIKDLWLLGGLVLLGAILCAVLFLRRKAGGEAASVSVTIDGELVGIYALSRDLELPIETQYGYNLLVIKGGAASVVEADCPDGICVMEHPASQNGEMIVCLPHRLVVEVISEGEASGSGTGTNSGTGTDSGMGHGSGVYLNSDNGGIDAVVGG